MNSIQFLKDIEKTFTSAELEYYAKLLNRSYDISYTDNKLWKTLNEVFEYRINNLISNYEPYLVANNIFNEILMKYFPGERVIKYEFIKKKLNIKKQVTLFEMYANNSRVDICRINGESIAYEIKTEIDSLDRLEDQVSDYSKLFEKIYVICSGKHYQKILKIIPETHGIILYRKLEQGYIFHTKRKAIKNLNLVPFDQLKNLSSSDLLWIIKQTKITQRPTTKSERLAVIQNNTTSQQINRLFKRAIKRKYGEKWNFICSNFNNIYPIDIQSFFKTPIEPKVAYFKKSTLQFQRSDNHSSIEYI